MGVARNKHHGAQLHMMVNMPVMFYDCGCYTFGLTRDTICRWSDRHKDKGKSICTILFQSVCIELTCIINMQGYNK